MEAAKETGVGNKRQRIYRYRLPSSGLAILSNFLSWQSQNHVCTRIVCFDNVNSAATNPEGLVRTLAPEYEISATLRKHSALVPAKCTGDAPESVALRGHFDAAKPCSSCMPSSCVHRTARITPSREFGSLTASEREGAMLAHCSKLLVAGMATIITATAERACRVIDAGIFSSSVEAQFCSAAQGDAKPAQASAEMDQQQARQSVAKLWRVQSAGDGNQSEAGAFGYPKVRRIRETSILKHVKKVGFVLAGEPRLLWFEHCRQVRLS